MTRQLAHKGLKRLYEDDDPRGVNGQHVEKLRDILARLDVASAITDMELPGFHLHALKGNHRGFWAVRRIERIIFILSVTRYVTKVNNRTRGLSKLVRNVPVGNSLEMSPF
jgi:proteic killer suppression protein